MSPAPSPALWAYRALTTAAEPLLPALLRARARRGKEDAARLPERLARAPVARPPGRLVWLHGASVGEGLSLLPLVEALGQAAPDATRLVTSGTVTSATLLDARLPADVLRRCAPVDAPGAARRFVAAWRPDLAVFAESEVWPNLLAELRRSGARTALVSARLSEASLRGWARAPGAAREVFGGFDRVLAQDDGVAAGLCALGARDDGRLNLKLAGAPLPVDAERLSSVRRAADGRPILLAASTHPGEDEIALDAYAPLAAGGEAPWLVIVPRHPQRGPAIAALAAARGLACTRQGAGEAFGGAPVHVADALGELGLWFRAAAAALLGGSLVPGVGGHNPAEPVRLGAPLLVGPHREAQRPLYAALEDAAVTVADAGKLATAWAADLADPAAARARAGRAAERLPVQPVGEAARRLADLLPPPP